MTRVIGVLRESAVAERRVAATPETVKKFIALGATVSVEAGATIADRESVLNAADIVLCIQGPAPTSLAGIRSGAWLVGNLDPFADAQRIEAYADLGLEALAMEFMPRITRAQSMDTLSSRRTSLATARCSTPAMPSAAPSP